MLRIDFSSGSLAMFAATRVVRDADGQQIAYVYYSNDPDRRSAAKLLTKDEARRVVVRLEFGGPRSWEVVFG